MALHSNENLTIKAADIESQGSLSATAGNMLNVTTLTVSNKEYYNGDADNYYRLKKEQLQMVQFGLKIMLVTQ